MVWLYILFGIVLLFTIILLIPISVIAKYSQNSFNLFLKIGFIKLSLVPSGEKKKNKKQKNKTPDKSEKEVKKAEAKTKKGKDLNQIVNIIKKAAKLVQGVLKDFFKHIIIKKMQISISVASENAADTAINYGYYCSVVYPAVGIIAKNTNCKAYGVEISPNFDEKASSQYDVDFEAKILFIWLVELVFKHGFKAINLLLELK